MKKTIRMISQCGRWFSIPVDIYYSIWSKTFFVECNRCSSFHQVEQLTPEEKVVE